MMAHRTHSMVRIPITPHGLSFSLNLFGFYLKVPPHKTLFPSALLAAALIDKPPLRTPSGSFLGLGSRLVTSEAPAPSATLGPGAPAPLRPKYLLDARPKLRQQAGTTLLPPTRLDIDDMRGRCTAPPLVLYLPRACGSSRPGPLAQVDQVCWCFTRFPERPPICRSAFATDASCMRFHACALCAHDYFRTHCTCPHRHQVKSCPRGTPWSSTRWSLQTATSSPTSGDVLCITEACLLHAASQTRRQGQAAVPLLPHSSMDVAAV